MTPTAPWDPASRRPPLTSVSSRGSAASKRFAVSQLLLSLAVL